MKVVGQLEPIVAGVGVASLGSIRGTDNRGIWACWGAYWLLYLSKAVSLQTEVIYSSSIINRLLVTMKKWSQRKRGERAIVNGDLVQGEREGKLNLK